MPEQMMFTTTRLLPTKSSVPPIASAVSSSCDGHG